MLQPGQRALVLLETLLAAEGKLVTKAELMDAAWPGLAVEESNLSVQIAALRKVLGRKPDGSEWIHTVQRVGYQMVLTTSQPNCLLQTHDGSDPAIGRPSIAVLPFDNLSLDPAEAFFSDGLTDEIITGLSRLRDVFVIARNTVFAYKGKPTDVRTLGAELGVEYILEGSVRSAGGRIRVMAQLVDARTGKHVWIDRYDGVAGDVFAIQDEITQKVVRKIGSEMLAAEYVRALRKPTRSLNAWECYVRALFLSARLSQEDSRAALILLNQAI